jgi:hypothetical protein
MSKTITTDKILRKDVKEADGTRYTYRLVMCESNKVASFKIPLYSVEVEMIDSYGNTTSARTGELFADVGKAISFYKKLCDNLATPLNLPYILEDEMQ